MGKSHTGGLDNILRFDITDTTGDMVFNPGGAETYDWIPVSDTVVIGVPEDEDAARDIDVEINLLDSCPAFGKKCENCRFLGHFSEQRKKKSKDVPEEQNHIGIKEMEMKMSLSNTMRILRNMMRQMKKLQNMTHLHHAEWCDKSQGLIKSSLPERLKMKLRMCIDISSCSKHYPGLGLCVENLLRSELNLSCANFTVVGKLTVFFAMVREMHHLSTGVVEPKTMVYVIEGDIVLVSRSVLEKLGCIRNISSGWESYEIMKTKL